MPDVRGLELPDEVGAVIAIPRNWRRDIREAHTRGYTTVRETGSLAYLRRDFQESPLGPTH